VLEAIRHSSSSQRQWRLIVAETYTIMRQRRSLSLRKGDSTTPVLHDKAKGLNSCREVSSTRVYICEISAALCVGFLIYLRNIRMACKNLLEGFPSLFLFRHRLFLCIPTVIFVARWYKSASSAKCDWGLPIYFPSTILAF
jgi:hypothetical protein